ncbi:MAG: ogr/Delta-like zinc finger family protein [Burkholderiaceae bacterium]
MSRRVLLPCPHCGAPPHFHKAVRLSDLETEFWYQCRDLLCGHTYIAVMEVSRTTKPPVALMNPAIEMVPVSQHAERWRQGRIAQEVKECLART